MNLYLKHRPTKLQEVVGNSSVKSVIRGMIRSKNIPHALLFSGPTGCGKTTLARILAKELGCNDMSTLEIDSAQFRGIDTIRTLKSESFTRPISSENKVYLIDEVHKLTNDAQTGFLKLLEDTPPYVYFMLCTTHPQKLIKAIRGRTVILEVELLNDAESGTLLNQVLEKEGKQISDAVIDKIVQAGEGHPRDTLNILEKVLSVPERLQEKTATTFKLEEKVAFELCKVLMPYKGVPNWRKVSSVLAELRKEDAEQIRRVVLGYATTMMLKSGNPLAADTIQCFFEPTYDIGFPGIVLACFTVCHNNN